MIQLMVQCHQVEVLAKSRRCRISTRNETSWTVTLDALSVLQNHRSGDEMTGHYTSPHYSRAEHWTCQDQSGWSVVDRRCVEISERFLVLFYLHSIYNDMFNGKYRHSSIGDARAHTPSLDTSSRHQFSNASLCVWQAQPACLYL